MDIVFFDEFGFSFQEPLARTWAPKGHRPILRRVEKARRGLSTAVALTLSGHLYWRHFPGGMKSAQTIDALNYVHRYLPTGFILIWDGASIHTSGETEGYLARHPEIIVEPLPPYAPELNPEEYCHGNVKQRLKNATPTDVDAVVTLIDRGLTRLRHHPQMLLSFIHHAGLSVRQLW